MSLQCPKCRQNGFVMDAHFHWCGDESKQCRLCGKDWPSNVCRKCYKVLVDGQSCCLENAVKIQKVKLPYPYEYNGELRRIEGWAETPGCLIISLPTEEREDVEKVETLTVKDTKILLGRLALCPANIPGYKEEKRQSPSKRRKFNSEDEVAIEHVTALEWEEFQRWKRNRDDLSDLADDALCNWKGLLNNLTGMYPEFDEDFDDLHDNLRKLPRLIRLIITGEYPPLELNDEDICYYDESYMLGKRSDGYSDLKRKKGKMVVKVIIEDISTGQL